MTFLEFIISKTRISNFNLRFVRTAEAYRPSIHSSEQTSRDSTMSETCLKRHKQASSVIR